MRIFDRQRLATWLFYAIITLFVVSFATTGLALYELLIAGTQADSAGSAYFYAITRGGVAAGTTLGIQTIALVLSLFFGGQLVRLFTASHVPKDLPFWPRALRLATSRGSQLTGVILIGALLTPFLAFSIAFSYATFHHTLEREEEIQRKALIEIPQMLRKAHGPIQTAIQHDIDRDIAIWMPSTQEEDENGNLVAQERLTLAAQFEFTLDDTLEALSAAINNEVPGLMTSEERQAVLDKIAMAQDAIERAEDELRTLEVELGILSGEIYWEHGYVFDFDDPDANDPRPNSIDDGGCRRGDFERLVDERRFAAAAGILNTILERPINRDTNAYNLEALSGDDNVLAREIRTRIRVFLLNAGTPVEYANQFPANLPSSEFDVQATADELRRIADALVTVPGRNNCSAERGDFFNAHVDRAIGILGDRDEARQIIADSLVQIAGYEEELANADTADRVTGAGRQRAVERALEQGLTDLREFVAEKHPNDERLAGALAGDQLDVLQEFAARIDNTLLGDVRGLLRGSFQQSACLESGSSIDTSNDISSYAGKRSCLDIAVEACDVLSEVFVDLQTIARDGPVGSGPVRRLACDGFAPPSDVVDRVAALHWAGLALKSVQIDETADLGDERIASLRKNAEVALEELTQTQPELASANLVRAYSRQVGALSETIANLDGRATVRRSWERMFRMLNEDFTISAWSTANPVGAAAAVSVSEAYRADQDETAGAASGIDYVYEFYAFAIAVMIDIMIVLMAVCVVILRRSTLIGAEAHNGARVDEQVIESAFSGISREDPTIFSTIVQHFKLTGDEDYPVSINISRIAGSPRRARILRILALLGNLVRKTTEYSYELRPAAQVYLQYLAADESHGVKANPEDFEGEPA